MCNRHTGGPWTVKRVFKRPLQALSCIRIFCKRGRLERWLRRGLVVRFEARIVEAKHGAVGHDQRDNADQEKKRYPLEEPDHSGIAFQPTESLAKFLSSFDEIGSPPHENVFTRPRQQQPPGPHATSWLSLQPPRQFPQPWWHCRPYGPACRQRTSCRILPHRQ